MGFRSQVPSSSSAAWWSLGKRFEHVNRRRGAHREHDPCHLADCPRQIGHMLNHVKDHQAIQACTLERDVLDVRVDRLPRKPLPLTRDQVAGRKEVKLEQLWLWLCRSGESLCVLRLRPK